MPFYAIWVNFSSGSHYEGDNKNATVGLSFRIGRLYGHLPANGKSICNCGCLMSRKARVSHPLQLRIDFEKQGDFDHCKDIATFYKALQNIISGQVSESVVLGRNIFCYHEKPIRNSILFDTIESEMKSKMSLWSSKTKKIGRTFMPIQVDDLEAKTINEWHDKYQGPIRKSSRFSSSEEQSS
jgi:hypothetical protein